MSELSSGNLCQLAGITKATLRHYLDIGLITPTRQTPAGYRKFDQHQLYQLYYIRFLRQIGCDLPTIQHLLVSPDATPELRQLQTQVAAQITQLQVTQQNLTALLTAQQSTPLNQLTFANRPQRFLTALTPTAVAQHDVHTAQALADQGKLSRLHPIIYRQQAGHTTTIPYQQVTHPTAVDLPAGTYAVQAVPITSEADLVAAATALRKDPLCQFVPQPDLIIYENLNLSLVYSQAVVYNLEVRLK
ncbi:MerR family transcriptional regulator [Levilactobacillus acidifarinae]|uniref:HTH merR-type domain-containing protein n=1 Tax=Levilactobacillus acidifarinae DSM 19394 = JCM 15949 TaxID=1423715 RepID=A0A0R1LVM9_9LACO|nr:MerR family transcriptional regulator [Levilactobacillus acidifarinae]KRK95671.1 hypothetical protein FD25_GL000086 [Levilactobacillus acidifarinae DSM 19394]GEO69407.1 hypothetical protein LAC03_13170 [Levilactobacillus acidifarinae]